MKERIYTIPINDAFDKNCECPICEFEKQQERIKIEYTLGASMMEPDERIFTNQKGFCEKHTGMLLGKDNKLSFALVLKTHLDELINEFELINTELNEREKQSFFKKNKKDIVKTTSNRINKRHCSCAVCEKLSFVMDSFVDNVLYLYFEESEFKIKFDNSKGFCLKHYDLMLNGANKHLKGKKLKEFCIKLSEIQIKNFKRVRDDVDWFTKKFDYRYEKEDWKNSKDSVQRASQKISGY